MVFNHVIIVSVHMVKNKSIAVDKKNHDKQGFSFLELMFAVLIMGVFFGMSLKLYSNFNWQKKLEAETKKVVAVLELAKKKAIAGDKSRLSQSCVLSGYKVIYTATSYSLLALCPAETAIGAYYNLPSGLALTGNGSNQVIFKPFGIGAIPSCIIVKNSTKGQCRKITIDQSGSITYGNEANSCSCS